MADTGTSSRLGIGVFTVAVSVVVAPLAILSGFLGFFVACFGDYDSDLCTADYPDAVYLAIYGAPVAAMLVVGTLATVRRSWKLAALGAGLSVLLLMAWFVIAIAVGSNTSS